MQNTFIPGAEKEGIRTNITVPVSIIRTTVSTVEKSGYVNLL